MSPAERRAVEDVLRHARALAQAGRHAIGIVRELEKLLAGDGGQAKETLKPS